MDPIIAFDPGGTQLFGAGRDGSARVWDAKTGSAVTPFLPHENEWIMKAAFDVTGEIVATGSATRAIRVWDTVEGELVQPVWNSKQGVTHLVFGEKNFWLAASVSGFSSGASCAFGKTGPMGNRLFPYRFPRD